MFTKRTLLSVAAAVLLVSFGIAGLGLASFGPVNSAKPTATNSVTGTYAEVRSCDVYTGPCFANGEMNLCGREAILSWSVTAGTFDGVKLDGLHVIAVVEADNTLGDVNRFPQKARSVLIVDSAANNQQRGALIHLAQAKAGALLGQTVEIDSAPVKIDSCPLCIKGGCFKMRAGNLVEIETRCLCGNDCVCHNEELFYPPLTTVSDAKPAYTTAAIYRGSGLGTQFDEANRRSAYLASFTQ